MDTVWMVVYEHRHGTDVELYETEQSAWSAAAALVAEYADELPEEKDRQRVRALLSAEERGEAVALYGECHPTEFITVEKKQIHAEVD